MGLLSVWLSVTSLALAAVMVVFRAAFNDVMVVLTLYSGISAYTLAGMVLWSTRKAKANFTMARLQCKLALVLAAPAILTVYFLVAMDRAHSMP